MEIFRAHSLCFSMVGARFKSAHTEKRRREERIPLFNIFSLTHGFLVVQRSGTTVREKRRKFERTFLLFIALKNASQFRENRKWLSSKCDTHNKDYLFTSRILTSHHFGPIILLLRSKTRCSTSRKEREKNPCVSLRTKGEKKNRCMGWLQ